MSLNLFPALVVAGPPHCGKSVLAYLLSQALRQADVAHYLLRAAPDGEGDWFLESDPSAARTLRADKKRGFNEPFIAHMRAAIEARLLPLLVDVGGAPQGSQVELLRACTHSILLYRDESERRAWADLLAACNLIAVAELRSGVDGESDAAGGETLHGWIGVLERDLRQRRVGPVFPALFDRVQGICQYDRSQLERIHRPLAPHPFVAERELALRVGAQFRGAQPQWQARDLPAALAALPAGEGMALYGRGPVWLAAALAAHSSPAPCAVFDACYGWLRLPEARWRKRAALQAQISTLGNKNAAGERAQVWNLALPYGVIEPEQWSLPAQARDALTGGVLLSGALPRWGYAALARALCGRAVWVGVFVPQLRASVIVHSHTPSVQVGDLFDENGEPTER